MRLPVRFAFTAFIIGIGFVLSSASEVSAQVLTFDEMTPNPIQSPILGTVVCSAGTGFRFSSDHFHIIDENYGAIFSDSGSTHLGYEAGRGFPIRLEREGTGTFSLFSLDAGEFYSAHDAERPDAERITLTGYRADGSIVTHTIYLDGIRDGVGGVQDFQHFVLPNTFVNLRAVLFTGLQQNDESGGIAFDNLEYQLTPNEALPLCTFQVLPSDIPTVSFVSPSPGAVAGTISIEANATDNTGVANVVFKLDGAPLAPPDTTAPYSLQWDTTVLPDGAYTLTAEAIDAATNVGTASISITIQNGIVIGTGPHYVVFDGLDDHLLVGDRPVLSFGTGTSDTAFTMEMWLRPDAVQGQHLLLDKSGEYRVAIIYGTLLVDLRDESTQSVAQVLSMSNPDLVGGWHHLAVTYDGRGGPSAANGITIYLDGQVLSVWRSTDPGYVAMENLSAPLTLGGGSDASRAFDGGLDEVRLWNVARTPAQIQAALNAELLGTETGLVAYWRFNEGVGWTGADDSPGNAVAALINGTAWAADGPLAPDTTAPQITNIATSNLTPSGVTITFTTNEPTTGWVSYVAGTACPCTDAFSAGAGTSHAVTLTGLSPDTQYRFVVNARDSWNNQQTAAPSTFRTLVLSSDLQPPTVSFVTPSAGLVSGTLSIEAAAADNVGVVSVVFKLDGVALGPADASAPYTLSWDTTSASEGAHTLTAEVRDAANNVGTASVAVLVQNIPTVTSPHYVNLDGVDDFVRVADAPALSFGTGTTDTPFTMEMWLRPDMVTARHQLLGKAGEYRVAIFYGTLVVDLHDESSGSRAQVLTTNAVDLSALVGGWHHLAITYDGRGGSTAAEGIAIYIDGVAVPLWRWADAGYVAMENLAFPLEIGHASDLADQYDGALDELRLWNVARTPAQIQAARNAELVGTETGLVAYWRFNEGVGITVADDSPANHPATLLAGTAWGGGGPLAPDTTAPQITSIATSNLTTSGVTITFSTNEPTTGWVSYVAGTACPCTDVFSAGPGTSHTVTLTGLSPNTQYRFVVNARDGANNLQTAAPSTFNTLTPSSDTQAPTVSFVTPSAGLVSGTLTIEANAADNVGVVSVVFKLDGVALGPADTSAPYTLPWNTTTAPEGAHTLTAEGRDAANNVGTASVAVLVQNIPTVTSPHYVNLDGVDDLVRVADAPGLSFGTGTTDTPFTMEMWLRPDMVTARHQLLGKAGEYRVAIFYGTLVVDLHDESSGSRAQVLTTNAVDLSALVGGWHHLAITYDGRGGSTAAEGIAIYIDGVAVPLWRWADAGYVAMENLAFPLEIGHASDLADQYDGALDELRLWNVARTPAQILATMNADLVGTETGLAAYWRFNEGAGATVADDSPANHAATLLAGTAWLVGGPY